MFAARTNAKSFKKKRLRKGPMEFLQAFPIAIIDEDYEGKHAAGRGMRQLADAIEKEGFRVVAGVSYQDARRLVEVFNSESCWLVSVDRAEAGATQWQLLEEGKPDDDAVTFCLQSAFPE